MQSNTLLVSFFCIWTISFLKPLLMPSVDQFVFWHLCQMLCALMFGSSVLFHWCPCLFCCQYHTDFIVLALQYTLRSVVAIPLVFFFLLTIVLAIWSLLRFHIHFRVIFFYFCKEWNGNFGWDCTESENIFGKMVIFTMLILPIYGNAFPFMNIFLYLFLQGFKVFIIEVLHFLV